MSKFKEEIKKLSLLSNLKSGDKFRCSLIGCIWIKDDNPFEKLNLIRCYNEKPTKTRYGTPRFHVKYLKPTKYVFPEETI